MRLSKWLMFHVNVVLCLALSVLIPMRAQGAVTIINECTHDSCTTTYISNSSHICFKCLWDQSCGQVFFGALNSNKWCIDIVSLRPDGTGGNLYCTTYATSCDPSGY